MKVVVGLGNPGGKYEGTRHNAGRFLVELMAKRWGEGRLSDLGAGWVKKEGIEMWDGGWVWLVKSAEYFMNESGKIVEALGRWKVVSDWGGLYVAHDDLDIRLGRYKIQLGKGPGAHGGVNDIERAIGKNFWRIRIGVDGRGVPRTAGEEYVLQKFSEEERGRLKSVADEIIGGLLEGRGDLG